MGPLPITYLHPWMNPEESMWGVEDDVQYCTTYYRYPEVPSYGFFVQSFSSDFFYVGPVKWEAGIPERSGTAHYVGSQDGIYDMVEGMYVKGLAMHKVYEITDLIDGELAPF